MEDIALLLPGSQCSVIGEPFIFKGIPVITSGQECLLLYGRIGRKCHMFFTQWFEFLGILTLVSQRRALDGKGDPWTYLCLIIFSPVCLHVCYLTEFL